MQPLSLANPTNDGWMTLVGGLLQQQMDRGRSERLAQTAHARSRLSFLQKKKKKSGPWAGPRKSPLQERCGNNKSPPHPPPAVVEI